MLLHRFFNLSMISCYGARPAVGSHSVTENRQGMLIEMVVEDANAQRTLAGECSSLLKILSFQASRLS